MSTQGSHRGGKRKITRGAEHFWRGKGRDSIRAPFIISISCLNQFLPQGLGVSQETPQSFARFCFLSAQALLDLTDLFCGKGVLVVCIKLTRSLMLARSLWSYIQWSKAPHSHSFFFGKWGLFFFYIPIVNPSIFFIFCISYAIYNNMNYASVIFWGLIIQFK